jgi:formate dehydrogenase iron-sulfur subunit
MQKTSLGPVIYDAAKCMGCRYCMMACPYEIPRYDWEATIPYVRKCILCYDRVKQGQPPACTEACPAKATIFGDRDALLSEAHRRIELRPDLYLNNVWGENDAGGSSVLYISGVDLSFLTGNAPVSGKPLPTLTSVAMESVPFAFCGVLGVMGSVSWIIERRIKRQKESEDEQSSET